MKIYEIYRDVAELGQLGFQDPASPIMEEIINFHNYVMVYLTFILVALAWMMGAILVKYAKSTRVISHKFLVHGTVIEFIWTVMPAFILIAIAFPSFKLLYLMDEVVDPSITIKAIGHQWYWSYEYSDYAQQDGVNIEFDSYMIPEDDLELGDLRLLEVDNKVIVPKDTHVRVVVSSADVLHCWAVPSLGVKVDANPGRLNQTAFLAERAGRYYGQCSEICGANHGKMPIVVEAVSLTQYCDFVNEMLQDARDEE
jgi:cytochrome c oxidase subunit 2